MSAPTIHPAGGYDKMLAEFSIETKRALYLIAHEMERAEGKHPVWPTDPIHAAAIVAEEAGECVQAALEHTYEGGSRSAIGEEAIHTGATALRLVKNLRP